MTTIVNTPPSNNVDNGMSMMVGLVIVVILGFLFFVYGLPVIRNMRVGTPQINVPSQIDVNVKQTQ